MKTIVPVTLLPLLLMSFVTLAQPQSIATLYEGESLGEGIEIDGMLYFSGPYYILKIGDENSGWEPIPHAGARAVNLKALNGVLYFTTYDNAANEATLWKYDAPAMQAETERIYTFTATYNHISPLITIGSTIYFGIADKLFKSDGTEEGTVLIKDLVNENDHSTVRLSKFQNGIFISLRKTDNQSELWKSNGSAGGTILINSFRHIELLNTAGNYLYFAADNGSSGKELWRTDASGNISLVKDLNVGPSGSFSMDRTVSAARENELIFSTSTPPAVWRTDGTSAGTLQLAASGAREIVTAATTTYFITGNELWKTDGTQARTTLLKKYAEVTNQPYPISQLTAHGNTLFFAVSGDDLWQTNGTAHGTILIADHSGAGGDGTGSLDLWSVGQQFYYIFDSATERYPAESVLMQYNPASVWITGLHLVDAVTDEDMYPLKDNSMILSGQRVAIRADASLATTKVTFAINGGPPRTETQRPFALPGDIGGDYSEWQKTVRTHTINVTPYDASGAAGQPSVYTIIVADPVKGCGTGTIVRQFWNNTTGKLVSDIPTGFRPSGTQMLTSFEGPTNSGINYGARTRGFICPPVTGTYTFWISSDDHSELWLSPDDSIQNKVRIAELQGSVAPREWNKFASQKSVAIHLVAGKRYYIEALHKQDTGTDHLAVGWQLPGGQMERPIPGNRLSPFEGNTPPEVRILSPANDENFEAPASILIHVSTKDDSSIEQVAIYAGTKLLHDGSTSYMWLNVPEGSYELTARATDSHGAVTTSESVSVTVSNPCAASGIIKREYWNGVSGDRVTDIPVNKPPTGVTDLSLFEAPKNTGNNYGARVRGFICPPVSGEYTFWIASNDYSELWLSTNEDPAQKQRIAYVNGATESRQWDKFTSQQSSPISLVNGKTYYIEALHKEGIGTDHLAVGWQIPGAVRERPIPGNRLSPFVQPDASFTVNPLNGSNDIDPMVTRLDVRPVKVARQYTLEMNTNSDFTGESIILNGVEDHQITFIVKDLAHSTTYYTRVKTDISGYGPVSQFTTRDPIQPLRLWGLTTSGGANEQGTIFSYSIDSARFLKHYDMENIYGLDEGDEHFRGSLVAGPQGTFYGHSEHEYNDNIFKLTSDARVEWHLYGMFFQDGNMVLGSDNFFYAANHGYLEGGQIERQNVDNQFIGSRIRLFNHRAFGDDPSAPLLEPGDGYLYGTASSGGIQEGGVVFRLRHTGSDFEVIHFFDHVSAGMNPVAGLTEENGLLFGTTTSGGAVDHSGTIFRMKPDGSDFSKLHDFDGINGRRPTGELLINSGVIYGVTAGGGNGNHGIIYRMNADATAFMKLHDFSGLDGSSPSGALVQDRNGNLYGMTTYGGANGLGVIFKVGSDGTGFRKLLDFSMESGNLPNGALVIREDIFTSSTVAQSLSTELTDPGIHPNPSTDHFNIHINSATNERMILSVTDQYGQLITTYEIIANTPMQFGAELKRGLYIMKVIRGKEILMQRVVKK